MRFRLAQVLVFWRRYPRQHHCRAVHRRVTLHMRVIASQLEVNSGSVFTAFSNQRCVTAHPSRVQFQTLPRGHRCGIVQQPAVKIESRPELRWESVLKCWCHLQAGSMYCCLHFIDTMVSNTRSSACTLFGLENTVFTYPSRKRHPSSPSHMSDPLRWSIVRRQTSE